MVGIMRKWPVNWKKKRLWKMKKSIKKQFACIFIGLMAATIMLCWILNTVFLQSYYVSDKEKTLFRAYERLNESSDLKGEEFEIEFETICSTNNIDALIIDGNGKQTISTVYYSKGLMLKLLDYLVNKNTPGVIILEKTDNYTYQK